MTECPKCRSLSTIPILYGKPSAEVLDAANRGLCELAGCVIEANAPTRRCLTCQYTWNEEHRSEILGHGYFVLLIYESSVSSLHAIKRHVRVPYSIDPFDAQALADAIILRITNDDENLRGIFGESNEIGSELGMWQRRLAQCGTVDEFSNGVQATYFSPNGILLSFLAYYNAEWLDE